MPTPPRAPASEIRRTIAAGLASSSSLRVFASEPIDLAGARIAEGVALRLEPGDDAREHLVLRAKASATRTELRIPVDRIERVELIEDREGFRSSPPGVDQDRVETRPLRSAGRTGNSNPPAPRDVTREERDPTK